MALRLRDLFTHPSRRQPTVIRAQKASRAMALDNATRMGAVGYGIASPKLRDYESYLRAYKAPWVRACVQVIAYNCANVGFRLVKPGTGNNGNEQEDEEILDSPFMDLLNHPNPNQSGFELREAWWTDLELTGNAYISLESKTPRGLPTEMYRIDPSRITILPDRVNFIAGYRYVVNGRPIDYAPDEMLHPKYANPLDPYYGMGVIESGEARFESEMAMAEHERNFWQSGAKITGILKTAETLDPATFERLSNTFKAFFQGSGYSTALLENGLEYQSVSDGPAKLGMLDMAKASRDQILAMFGVPATKLGILERANYKADEADRYFWCFTAGTPITVKDRGEVPIEEIQSGDLLLTHMGRYRPVVEARSREYYGWLYTVILARDAVTDSSLQLATMLECSEEHPFYTWRSAGPEWVKVPDLVIGDEVLGCGPYGEPAEDSFVIHRIVAISSRQATGERIYNMEVAEDHSYTAAGVLAHNTETCDPKLTRIEEAMQPLVDLFHPGEGLRMRFKRLNFSDDLPQMQVAKTMSDVGVFSADEIRQYTGHDPLPEHGDVLIAQAGTVPIDLGGPMATINERRKDLGLPPIEGGDAFIILPNRSVPLDVSTGEVAGNPPKIGAPNASESSQNGSQPSNVVNLPRQPAAPSLPAEPAPVAAATASKASQSVSILAPATSYLIQQHRAKANEQAVAVYQPRLSAFFASQQARVLDRLAAVPRRQKASITVSGLWDDSEEDQALTAELEPLWTDALTAGVAAARAVGVPILAESDARMAQLKQGLAARVVGINSTTRDAVAAAVEEGLRRGYSSRQIASGVSDEDYTGIEGAFSETKGYRASMIARTEMANAYLAASLDSFKQSGVVKMVQGQDGTRDPTCADRNGLVLSLDEAMQVQDHVNGSLGWVPLLDS